MNHVSYLDLTDVSIRNGSFLFRINVCGWFISRNYKLLSQIKCDGTTERLYAINILLLYTIVLLFKYSCVIKTIVIGGVTYWKY